MQPVLEIYAPDDFALWPIAAWKQFEYLTLNGGLDPAEVGIAIMRIAECNDLDPDPENGDDRPPRPADPTESFLHGLLTFDSLHVTGGLRVTDTSTGITFVPGCCGGLEDWRDWSSVTDGTGAAMFGHDPVALAERDGDTVRLTVDREQSDSPVIELPVTDLRHLLAGAERDLTDFHQLAANWIAQHLPDQAIRVTAAVADALDLLQPNAAP
ncbi:hypothetical protein [Kitasatospora sp. MMS16-BH015]|uniref:hypothetical protein n=1 Tax=Kitasatospora sp. MMS16-BH015 TaxID=2018025 RepID=UPI001C2C0710|nr:hypothetical protein [Kitasatospora sp. MMS16-BH015]